MTNEEAIKYLQWVRPIKPYSFDKKGVQEAIDMAIKALQDIDFLTFLMNIINPNEMEVYLSMYNAQNVNGSEEERGKKNDIK